MVRVERDQWRLALEAVGTVRAWLGLGVGLGLGLGLGLYVSEERN